MVTGDQDSGSGGGGSTTAIDGFIISLRGVNRAKMLSPFESMESIGAGGAGAGASDGMKGGGGAGSIINNWETISVSSKMNGYTLRSLRCGTSYRLRVEAFNEMGSGEQSDTLEFSTLGRGKRAFTHKAFLKHF